VDECFEYRHVGALGWKMPDSKREQRVNIKFLVKLKKSTTETFQLLTEAYGEDYMSHAHVLNGTNDFWKAGKV
jgi:hypothetical protein